jgi:16S rRNA (uracil1498-N3)-methyltransferase
MIRTPAWPPRSAPRLFVDEDLAPGAKVTPDGDQTHYLLKVMRVTEGDSVILCSDIAGEWATTVLEAGRRTIVLRVEQQLRGPETVPDFTLCAALLKRDRFDLLLEKATELGARRIVPVVTRRCVADKLNGSRARRIVTEAAEQCGRTSRPLVSEPVPLDRLLEELGAGKQLFFADELGGASAAPAFALHPGPASLLTGPEGGFDDEERAAIRRHPRAVPMSLGPRILRAETAALAGTALWMGVAGDWTEALEKE